VREQRQDGRLAHLTVSLVSDLYADGTYGPGVRLAHVLAGSQDGLAGSGDARSMSRASHRMSARAAAGPASARGTLEQLTHGSFRILRDRRPVIEAEDLEVEAEQLSHARSHNRRVLVVLEGHEVEPAAS
jgi:hypothetical protein